MMQQTESVLKTLERDMKVSPIPVPGEKRPVRTVLADGYVRLTKEQEMFTTKRYRTRRIRKIIIWVLVIVIVTLLLIGLVKVGLLKLRFY